MVQPGLGTPLVETVMKSVQGTGQRALEVWPGDVTKLRGVILAPWVSQDVRNGAGLSAL